VRGGESSGYNHFTMAFTLLEADEEADMGVYGAYLRAQGDADLLDIAQHLDSERYPARVDAAGREMQRRGLLHMPAYTATEGVMRYLALGALALAAVTLLLTALLTSDEAAGPSWPTGEMLPDGTPVSVVAGIFAVAVLRGIVVWCAHFGVFTLLLAPLGGWLLGQVRNLRPRRVRADVLRLAGFAVLILLLVMGLAAGPRSEVPALFPESSGSAATPWQCALPLWDPFVSY
jgi:hypothetical protein